MHEGGAYDPRSTECKLLVSNLKFESSESRPTQPKQNATLDGQTAHLCVYLCSFRTPTMSRFDSLEFTTGTEATRSKSFDSSSRPLEHDSMHASSHASRLVSGISQYGVAFALMGRVVRRRVEFARDKGTNHCFGSTRAGCNWYGTRAVARASREIDNTSRDIFSVKPGADPTLGPIQSAYVLRTVPCAHPYSTVLS